MLDAELWGIYKVLKVAWDLGLQHVMVETDFKEAFDLLQNGKNMARISHLVPHLIDLLSRNWQLRFSHVQRAINRTADAMPKVSRTLPFGATRFSCPPDAVRPFLLNDLATAA
ncbi:uncharacterized protein LOC120142775 [Hibiscus syriacus]|uniref:uncharacterized protein LOC120142775 n=1 Tax=Hibiscus syriacus TaxID=106335 RepID=UPI0019212C01|nr:uncharacterized protein LOC120142775 [Hibiscus syriacus]